MAWIDEAQRTGRTGYRVFRGTFSPTSAIVAWSDGAFGSLDPRVLGVSGGRTALPESVGGAPERVSVNLELDNQDGSLTKYLIGTSGAASTEYTTDSFLNLSGKLYLGFIDSTGAAIEYAITPTLFCSGTVTATEHAITLSLASSDDGILGEI